MKTCLVLSIVWLAACGGHGATPDASTADAMSTSDMIMTGDMAAPFPAVTSPDVPIETSQGGPIMTTPKVVLITFPAEDSLTQLETFVSTLGATSYWSTATTEYGVGALTMATSIQSPTVPAAMITDDDIQTFLASMLDGTHPEYPTPDNNTIYALFYPAGVTITDGPSESCAAGGFGGYHSEMGLENTEQRVTYAVLPRCTDEGTSTFDYTTSSASHEFMEASEDPQPFTNPAYETVDDSHYEWARILGGGESADLCAQRYNADFKPDGFAFSVQRNWSNVSAKKGDDPCIPAAAGSIYFNLSPVTKFDALTITEGGQSAMVDGFSIPVGSTRTIELEVFSDSPLPAPLMLGAHDETTQSGATSPVVLTLSQDTAVNGDHVTLTITAKAAFTSHSGVGTIEVGGQYTDPSTMLLTSQVWYGLIATPAAASQ